MGEKWPLGPWGTGWCMGASSLSLSCLQGHSPILECGSAASLTEGRRGAPRLSLRGVGARVLCHMAT
jgi:hypothetical protein